MKPLSFSRRTLGSVVVAMLLAVAIGCSGGGSGTKVTTSFTPSTPATSSIQVNIGDLPGRVAAFAITVNAVTLTNSTGGTVNVLAAPVTVELAHLAGTTTPLATLNIPQGTYTAVSITLASPQVTVIDPVAGQPVQKTLPAAPLTRTVTLNPALTLGATASQLNLDLDLDTSLAIDALGNVSFDPKFLATHGPLGGATPPKGENEPIVGTISAVSGASFTLITKFGKQTLTFTTNSSTVFRGVSGTGALTSGMSVLVLATAQSDGSLLATKVGVLSALPQNFGVQGLITKVGSNQFQLVLQNGFGGMMSVPLFAGGITVNWGPATIFRIDDDISLSGLPFTPTFDATTLSPGQQVEVDATIPPLMVASVPAALTATQVQLEPQPVVGTVASTSTGSFVLTLPAESFFTTLTKATSVTVYTQNAKVSGTITTGATVVARGLLFINGTTLNMAAGQVGVKQ